MKIYTRTGDDGTTGLPGGIRVPKSDPRVECCGAVDELNASLGVAIVSAAGEFPQALRRVQSELLLVGAHLAAPADSPSRPRLRPVDAGMAQRLEEEIDQAELQLPPLSHFMLPGGCELAARLHLARTICRRAERLVVALHQRQPVSATILMYLNRLGDWLFFTARLANHRAGVEDVAWKDGAEKPEPRA